jgi:competence transcription factor ComK
MIIKLEDNIWINTEHIVSIKHIENNYSPNLYLIKMIDGNTFKSNFSDSEFYIFLKTIDNSKDIDTYCDEDIWTTCEFGGCIVKDKLNFDNSEEL